jgi:hypothetical protein
VWHQGLSLSFWGVHSEGYPCYAWIVKGRLSAVFFYGRSALRSFKRLNGEELAQAHSSPPGLFHAGAKSAVILHGLCSRSIPCSGFSTGKEGGTHREEHIGKGGQCPVLGVYMCNAKNLRKEELSVRGELERLSR